MNRRRHDEMSKKPKPPPGFPPMQGRSYSPGLARFLTQARLQEMMGGEHPYGYAFGNPLRYVDPSGKTPDNGISLKTKADKSDCDRYVKPGSDPTGCMCCALRALGQVNAPCAIQGVEFEGPVDLPSIVDRIDWDCLERQCGHGCSRILRRFYGGQFKVFGSPGEWYVGIYPGPGKSPLLGAGVVIRF